ncbi:hypothetical protein EPN96_04525 [bacterium]|nr:MAG: hypothetical protein EPN96_04525 [bacterium]
MIYLYILILIMILVPLIPSILIYKMFPNSVTKIKGKFANLAFVSTGAFGGYLLVLFILYKMLGSSIQAQLGSFNLNNLYNNNKYKTVSANLKLQNQHGAEVSGNRLNDMVDSVLIATYPRIIDVTGNKVTIGMPITNEDWSNTTVIYKIPRFGCSDNINLENIVKNNNDFVSGKISTINLGEVLIKEDVDTDPAAIRGVEIPLTASSDQSKGPPRSNLQ